MKKLKKIIRSSKDVLDAEEVMGVLLMFNVGEWNAIFDMEKFKYIYC